MRAMGLDNLKVVEMPSPKPGRGEALVWAKYVGLNPIDYFVVWTRWSRPLFPICRAPSSWGVVEDVGPDVGGLSPAIGSSSTTGRSATTLDNVCKFADLARQRVR